MKRRVTEEERKLFKAHIDAPRPLKAATRKSSKLAPDPPPPRMQSTLAGELPVAALIARGQEPARKSKLRRAEGDNQIDGHTVEKLKRGELQPAVRIDLHGMTEAAAHGALLSFLAGAQARGHRLALVVTGVGNPRAEEGAEWMRVPHGVLKHMVPRWLNEKEFAALAMGSAPAHRRHGGDGALYVYLRKKG
jgi:DNA-nicking Smr family endonuclease